MTVLIPVLRFADHEILDLSLGISANLSQFERKTISDRKIAALRR